MYWFGFDAVILIASILILVLACAAFDWRKSGSGLGTVALGVGIAIVALITGNLSSFHLRISDEHLQIRKQVDVFGNAPV